MHSFTYGSRVVENERQARLESNVRKIGNLLQAIVHIFVTFFLFVLINLLLRNLVQHTQLTFVKMLHFVQESAEVLFGQSAMSALYFAYQQSLYLLLAVAFSCVYQFCLVIKSLILGKGSVKGTKATYANHVKEFDTVTGESAVSYKYKVCFLS